MPLTRIDTGEAAKPLEQLQAINEDKYKDLENSLLKEALAISNDKCNNLIIAQNSLVEDLIFQVEKVKANNEWHEAQLESKTNKAVQEIRQIAQEERRFKSEVSQAIRIAIQETADEVTAYVKSQMDKSTEEVKRELAESAKEIRKQREDLKESVKFSFGQRPPSCFYKRFSSHLRFSPNRFALRTLAHAEEERS